MKLCYKTKKYIYFLLMRYLASKQQLHKHQLHRHPRNVEADCKVEAKQEKSIIYCVLFTFQIITNIPSDLNLIR